MDDKGTPKIVVELPGVLGEKKVEQVKVDSNRLHPVAEQRRLWLEENAIPARTPDILLHAACWIAGAGFTTSFLASIPLNAGVTAVLLVMLSVLLGVSFYAARRFPELRVFLFYRSCLVGTGISLGMWL